MIPDLNPISIVFGLIGGVGGSLTTFALQKWQEKAKTKTELKYASILLICHLDRLVIHCSELAFDDGTMCGLPAGDDGTHRSTVSNPTFDPLSIDVKWKSLPEGLMYDILTLPYHIELLSLKVDETSNYDDPPEYSETFRVRQSGYAEMGLKISGIMNRLRDCSGLPAFNSSTDELIRETRLREQRKSIDDARANYLAQFTS